MSAATLREIRNTLLLAAHEASWQPRRAWEVSVYVCRARALHRQLMRLQGVRR